MKFLQSSLLLLVITVALTSQVKAEEAKQTVKEVVDAHYSQGAIALAAALKKAGHTKDGDAVEKLRLLRQEKTLRAIAQQFEAGALTNPFSSEMQTAMADKLPKSIMDAGKIAALEKCLKS